MNDNDADRDQTRGEGNEDPNRGETTARLRISNTDRESALTALGEHLETGRITLDEYGDRSALITTSKTRGELLAIFADLPQPHPQLDEATVATAPPSTSTTLSKSDDSDVEQMRNSSSEQPLVQRLAAGLVSLSTIAAVVLFFALGFNWLWFLMPVALTALSSGIWGQDWKDQRDHSRNHRRELRSDRHRQRRNYRRGIED